MTTWLNDRLRLEIDALGAANEFTNHSGQTGTNAPWQPATAGAGPAVSAQSTGAPAGMAYAGWAIRAAWDSTSDTALVTDQYLVMWPDRPAIGGQYYQVQVQIALPLNELAANVGFENQLRLAWGLAFADTSNSYRSVADFPVVALTGTGAVGPRFTTILLTSPRVFVPSSADGSYPLLRLRVYNGDSATQPVGHKLYHGRLFIARAMETRGGPDLAPIAFTDVQQWTNLAGDSVGIKISRGLDLDGVTERLEVGTLTAIIRGAGFDPVQNVNIRPGRALRCTVQPIAAGTRSPVFTGTVSTIDTSYGGKNGDDRTVTIVATDLVDRLAAAPKPAGTQGNLRGRMMAATLDMVPIPPMVIEDGGAIGITTNPPSQIDDGTVLDQLALARNSLTDGTRIYVDKAGNLHGTTPAGIPAETEQVYSDTALAGAIHFRDIDASFGSSAMINTLMVRKLDGTADGGQTLYGPYANAASVETWGRQAAELIINEGLSRDAALAKLAVFSVPSLFVRSITFDCTGDQLAYALAPEIYGPVQVILNQAGINGHYRILGIEHEISAKPYKAGSGGRWAVTLKMLPLKTAATIVVSNPVGGAETGPRDTYLPVRVVQASRYLGTALSIPNAAGTGITGWISDNTERDILVAGGVFTMKWAGTYISYMPKMRPASGNASLG